MGLRTRLSLLVILPIMAVVGVYGVVRVRSETRAAIETERRAAAVAALAVQIAVEQGLRTGDSGAIGRLVAELVLHHPQVERVRVFERTVGSLERSRVPPEQMTFPMPRARSWPAETQRCAWRHRGAWSICSRSRVNRARSSVCFRWACPRAVRISG